MTLRTKDSLEDKLDAITTVSASLKSNCMDLSSKLTGGSSLSASRVLAVGNDLSTILGKIDTLLADPELVDLEAYAKTHYNSVPYSLTASLNSIKTAVESCVTYIGDNLPKDNTNTYYNVVEVGPNGSSTFRTFTNAQLAGFTTKLDDIAATVE
jgi:hypothetical protein